MVTDSVVNHDVSRAIDELVSEVNKLKGDYATQGIDEGVLFDIGEIAYALEKLCVIAYDKGV